MNKKELAQLFEMMAETSDEMEEKGLVSIYDSQSRLMFSALSKFFKRVAGKVNNTIDGRLTEV